MRRPSCCHDKRRSTACWPICNEIIAMSCSISVPFVPLLPDKNGPQGRFEELMYTKEDVQFQLRKEKIDICSYINPYTTPARKDDLCKWFAQRKPWKSPWCDYLSNNYCK